MNKQGGLGTKFSEEKRRDLASSCFPVRPVYEMASVVLEVVKAYVEREFWGQSAYFSTSR